MTEIHNIFFLTYIVTPTTTLHNHKLRFHLYVEKLKKKRQIVLGGKLNWHSLGAKLNQETVKGVIRTLVILEGSNLNFFQLEIVKQWHKILVSYIRSPFICTGLFRYQALYHESQWQNEWECCLLRQGFLHNHRKWVKAAFLKLGTLSLT